MHIVLQVGVCQYLVDRMGNSRQNTNFDPLFIWKAFDFSAKGNFKWALKEVAKCLVKGVRALGQEIKKVDKKLQVSWGYLSMQR